MKYILFIPILSLAIACGGSKEKMPSTPEEKAQQMISDTIKSTLPHPDSYQPISFSGLDSTFSDPQLDSAEYYQQQGEYYIRKAEEELMGDYKKSKIYSDSSLYFSNKVHEYLQTHTKEFNGFVMVHIYQAGDAANLLTKKKVTVYFDPNMRIVGMN